MYLAWLEFIRCFRLRPPAGRDFAYLTLLLGMIQLLALMMLSGREGLTERSFDVMVGNTPGYGVPIWVRTNRDSRARGQIDRLLLNEFEDLGIKVEPFRTITDPNYLALPGTQTWNKPIEGERSNFIGLTANLDGPLKPRNLFKPDLSNLLPSEFGNIWEIILDIDVFSDHFDLVSYKQGLNDLLPKEILGTISSDTAHLPSMSVLWMIGNRNGIKQLIPFRITWGKYVGTSQRPADFIIPIELWTARKFDSQSTNTCYDWTAGPKPSRPIDALEYAAPFILDQDVQGEVVTLLHQWQERFDGEVADFSTGGATWTSSRNRNRDCPRSISRPLAEIYFQSLMSKQSAIQLPPVRPYSSTKIVSSSYGTACSGTNWTSLADCQTVFDFENRQDGYVEMMVYAPSRENIEAISEYITCQHANTDQSPQLCELVPENRLKRSEQLGVVDSRLFIDQLYRDSLNRFAYLSDLLITISRSIGLVLGFLLFIIVWVQFGTVLGHRKRQYGMFVLSGQSAREIGFSLCLQGGMSAVFAACLAYVSFIAARLFLTAPLEKLAFDHDRIVKGYELDILPHQDIAMHLIVCVLTAVVCIITAGTLLYLEGIRDGHSIEKLLK